MENIQPFILNILKIYGTDIVWIIILFFFGRAILRLIVKRLVQVVDDGDVSGKISNKESF